MLIYTKIIIIFKKCIIKIKKSETRTKIVIIAKYIKDKVSVQGRNVNCYRSCSSNDECVSSNMPPPPPSTTNIHIRRLESAF